MGDGLKISKDKRHRSSSSLAGVLDGTRSERRLELRASIPEVEDQFAVAEARCDNLQEKIDLVKVLKRKKKLKKRSMTRLTESPLPENVPFISVRTQPKKTVVSFPSETVAGLLVTEVSQAAARLRRLERARGPPDLAALEQRRMLALVRAQQVRAPDVASRPLNVENSRASGGRARADGDGERGRSASPASRGARADDEPDDFEGPRFADACSGAVSSNLKVNAENRSRTKQQQAVRCRYVPREPPPPKGAGWEEGARPAPWRAGVAQQRAGTQLSTGTGIRHAEERPVVELFNKSRDTHSADCWKRQTHTRVISPIQKYGNTRDVPECDSAAGQLDAAAAPALTQEKEARHPRRVRYRSRRYELPTISSQMKQTGARMAAAPPPHNLPFVVSRSTAPSHNVGVNLQQVLNGLKIQQPLSGIPLTIAHHMGLGHIPTYGARSITRRPPVGSGEMNAIWVSGRVVRVPSRRCVSYGRLLALYREGDGIVPRFLRALARPHFFYTSMYNLPTHREDLDGATSKGRGGSQEAKRSLAEYAGLYREFERVEAALAGASEPASALSRRRDELAHLLAAREDRIRKVVQEYRAGDAEPLRASASTADDAYRRSSFRLGAD